MLDSQIEGCAHCPVMTSTGCVFQPKKLSADTLLLAQGGLAESVAIIRKGIVSLTAVDEEGDQLWATIRGPRSVLGLESLKGVPTELGVRTLTEVEMCTAPLPSLVSMLQQADGAHALFDLALQELLKQRRDINWKTGSVEGRVARFVLACERLLHGGRDQPLSKVRMASLLGIRPETLSRVLNRFAARKLVDSTRGIQVLDRQALSRLAGDALTDA